MLKRLLLVFFVATFVTTLSLAIAAEPSALAAPPPGPFFQGFEKNTDGWFDSTNGGDGTITRRPSGYSNSGGYADAINSSSGKYHARLDPNPPPCVPAPESCFGPFTRWGGYTSTFPQGGYLTQVDVYLDVGWAASHPDTRFDLTSAINQSTPATPTHRRDFFFNAGTQSPADPNLGTIPGFWVNTGTNGFRDSSFPWNPCPNGPDPVSGCRLPVLITQSGWYTLRHTFRAGSFFTCPESTCLVVDFDIFRGNSTAAHWTLHSTQDPMSMVGGNRYGWFNMEEIPDLPLDNTLRTGLCRKGDGDGDFEDKDGHKHHAHFHGNSCENGGDVEDDDSDSGKHFESSSVNSSTFTLDEDSQTMTMVGTGLDDGLPVAFTMVLVDFGDVAPALYTLSLSDGRLITGPLIAGSVVLQ